MTDPLRRYGPWLYAAAAYNVSWGSAIVVAPELLFQPLRLAHGNLVGWQAVGMLVALYAPVYLWSARRPSENAHLIVPAFVGKILGPIGFVWAFASGRLPLAFGLTIITNDLFWLPAFGLYLHQAARQRGGLRMLLSGAWPAESRARPQTVALAHDGYEVTAMSRRQIRVEPSNPQSSMVGRYE